MRQFGRKDMFRHFYAIRGLDWIFTRVWRQFLSLRWRFHFPNPWPFIVGEDQVRLERMIVAVLVALLAAFMVPSTASATGEDPGMTHGSVEMTHG